MPEYIYLLENRLSAAQKNALAQVRDAAREAGMTVFLAGGAVRDLTTGSSVRDLDFSIQGNALDLQTALEARGGTLWGRHEPSRTLFFWFPGSVRVEVVSTRQESFPKPGEPVYTWSGIVDDLHRRDFTANAMALSLNEGSYGLLLDPLNGVADIEARQLRLVSNYGFLEDPSRLIRAVRLRHRLGWQLEERTATRYENAKEADNFHVISAFLRGYELEKIAAEEEALSTLKALEAEGWMAKLLPSWSSASVDTAALDDLHRNRIQLLMQDVSPDLSAAHLEVLTAKMSAKDRDTLKKMMVRPGLLAQWEGLDAAAKEFGRLLTSKEAALPSATWKLFHAHAAEPILWLAHSRKSPAIEAKFKNFFSVWPEAAKKVPIALMLELRITPELPIYPELLRELFLEQIDGNLETDEQMRLFLERYSPPAPPPPVTLRRSRAKKTDGRSKRKEAARDEDDDDLDDDRPAKRSDDDDEDEDLDDAAEEDVDDEKPLKPEVEELAIGGRKLTLDKITDKIDLDKIDLGAVLGRIERADDEDVEDDIEDIPDGASVGGLDDTLDSDEDAEEEPDTRPAKTAAKAGAPQKVAPARPLEKPAPKPEASAKTKAAPAKPEAAKPEAAKPAASESAAKAAAKPASPAAKDAVRKAPAQPEPAKKAAPAGKQSAPPAAAKKTTAKKAAVKAPAKAARPATKTPTGKTAAAAKKSPAPAKKQLAKAPAKAAAKPAKKAAAKAAKPVRKR